MRMAGGKTVTCLTAIDDLIHEGYIRKAIIMSPPLVAATVWPREAPKWEHLQHLRVADLTGTPKQRIAILDDPDSFDVLSVSDAIVKWLVDYLLTLPEDHPLLDLIAYDEPKMKNPRGHMKKQLKRIDSRIKIMWMFSGTPRPNGYEDLFGPMQVLDPDAWPDDFDVWRRRNFMQMDYSGYAWEVHDFRAKQLDEDLSKVFVRAAEPPNARKGTMSSGEDYDRLIELPDEARKKYDEMERDLIIEVMEATGDVDEAVLIAALSQAVASSKLSQIAQGFIYDAPEEEDATKIAHVLHEEKSKMLEQMLTDIGAENTIITYGFRPDIDAIKAVLDKEKRSYGVLGGGVTLKRKLAIVDKWNEGKLDNLILHPASAGHGVELQFGGRRMIHFHPTWSAEQYDQVIKRIDRPGQDLHCYSHQIIANNTVDIVKRNRVEFKMNDQEAFRNMLRTL
jgi:SNF2 family DNA or RNA helicase